MARFVPIVQDISRRSSPGPVPRDAVIHRSRFTTSLAGLDPGGLRVNLVSSANVPFVKEGLPTLCRSRHRLASPGCATFSDGRRSARYRVSLPNPVQIAAFAAVGHGRSARIPALRTQVAIMTRVMNSGHAIARHVLMRRSGVPLPRSSLPLPSIERGHRRQDIDAEAARSFIDERNAAIVPGARRSGTVVEDQDNVNDVSSGSPSMPGSRVVDVASSLAVSSWRFNRCYFSRD